MVPPAEYAGGTFSLPKIAQKFCFVQFCVSFCKTKKRRTFPFSVLQSINLHIFASALLVRIFLIEDIQALQQKIAVVDDLMFDETYKISY